ncbi:expressed unknown protein [Seminavis robusta]|uniref:Uncharacterized protein n=1 Tax=Seminavis robusta TaxID=568900 RepID=A0A9N8E1L2_9STRA|nr:expressed unknown protein [Seminavis robusta]|eukprot:Sro465_g148610.1 n/a (338) ;mRNA; f:36979-37992
MMALVSSLGESASCKGSVNTQSILSTQDGSITSIESKRNWPRSKNVTLRTNYRMPISIEPTTEDTVNVTAIPNFAILAEVASVGEGSDAVAVTFMEYNDSYVPNEQAGINVQFPADQLKRLLVDGNDDVQVAPGFTSLADIEIEGAANVLIKEVKPSNGMPWNLTVDCIDCVVQVVDSAPVLLQLTGGEVTIIGGDVVEGSYMQSGTLTVAGQILGLEFTGFGSDDDEDKDITTSTSCAAVEYDEFFGSPCKEDPSISATTAAEIACTAPTCEVKCTQTVIQTDSSYSRGRDCETNTCGETTGSASTSTASAATRSLWQSASILATVVIGLSMVLIS